MEKKIIIKIDYEKNCSVYGDIIGVCLWKLKNWYTQTINKKCMCILYSFL